MDERRTQLNCYLQAIIDIPCVVDAPVTRECLRFHEAGLSDSAKTWLDALPPVDALAAQQNVWESGRAHACVIEIKTEVWLFPGFYLPTNHSS